MTALAACLLAAQLLGGAQAYAQADAPAAPGKRGETRLSLSLGNEGAYFAGMRLPLARAGNLALLQPSFAYRRGDRWRVSTSLAALASTQRQTHARLRVKEAYFSVSAGDLDLTAGKKLLRWGAGYAFTPTGVLDPPRLPTDPTDRLNLNEGREMAHAAWIHGRHAVSAVWASAGLLQKHRPGVRETTALRYNTLLAGFDTSLIVAHDRGGTTFTGGNFTRVFGEAVEVHAEFARRTGRPELLACAAAPGDCLPGRELRTAILLGGKYTPRPGWSVIAEYYSPVSQPVAGAPGARRQYAFARLGKMRLRELPGWKEWDLGAAVIANLEDHSRIVVLDAERRFGNHFSFYARALLPGGKRWQSEYGMIPYTALISVGFRVQL